MPYASFVRPMKVDEFGNEKYHKIAGIAVHGTPKGSWWRLGKHQGSHGCVRMHPPNAKYLSVFLKRSILKYGARNVGFTVATQTELAGYIRNHSMIAAKQ